MEMNMNMGQVVLTFAYNDEGIRTSKKSGSVEHIYTLNGSQIVSETVGNVLLVYLYDASGAPIGLQYRTTSYAAGVFDTYYFEKNIFGDIVSVYTEAGIKIGSYTYDAWGTCTVSTVSGNTTLQSQIVRSYNPFRYRGYYYDTETQLYYLQSRYYNPATGRFLNADGYVSTGTGLLGFNMYAYCSNNPVMRIDNSGFVYQPNPALQDLFMDLMEYYLNTDPEVVKKAKVIAFYKGVPVIKIDVICDIFFDGKDQGASYGVIFISSGHDDFETVLNHEYGHIVQLRLLGLFFYTTEIAIPSVTGYWQSKEKPMGDKYFDQPHEITADMFGGVDRGTYADGAKERGIEYFIDAYLKSWGVVRKKERPKYKGKLGTILRGTP